MATAIQIKRGTGSAAPVAADLIEGELAYAEDRSNDGASAKLYISSINSSSAEVVQTIGGKYYTDIVDGATNANTASKLVKRDGSGNFSAGTITANLTGNASGTSGSTTGNAATATKIASITNSNIVQLAETQTLTNKTLTSPTLTTPALGTPASGVMTNVSGTAPSLTAGTATVATTVTITDNENTNENNAIIFTAGGDLDGGNLGLESDGDLHYNPSTGLLTSAGLTASGTVQWGSLSDGAITVTAFVDEDNMSTNSATLIPTQQSVKAYVDTQVATAASLDDATALAIALG